MTRAGVILGTAAYMAPEQARGAAVDKRADIWAFGVVLFEMLAGRPCFAGDTVTDVLAAVVKSEPDWAALPAHTPPRVRQLLHRCLAKDRRQRLHDIGDARLEIEAALASLIGGEPGSASALGALPAAAAGFWSGRRLAVFGLLPLAALVLGLGAALSLEPDAPGRSGCRRPRQSRAPRGACTLLDPAISPDGRIVAFVSAGQNERPSLYVRELTKNFSLRPIPETEDADSPFFSPDGQSIAFFARGQLLRVSLDGGLPVPVAPAPAPLGGTWGDDGSIVFTPTLSRGLVRVTLKDGPPETLIRPDGRSTYAVTYPTFLPGARELLFSAWGMNVNVERLTLADGKRFPVVAMFASNALHAGRATFCSARC